MSDDIPRATHESYYLAKVPPCPRKNLLCDYCRSDLGVTCYAVCMYGICNVHACIDHGCSQPYCNCK